MWIWPQVASCDLRLHVGLHFRCNERRRDLWHSEQKQQLHLRNNDGDRPRKLWHAEPKRRRTEATEHRPHEARKQRPGARKKNEKKARVFEFRPHTVPKCFQSSFREAWKVPSTTKVHLEASSEMSPGGSWDLPGRPRERLGELRERLGDHFKRILELRGRDLS